MGMDQTLYRDSSIERSDIEVAIAKAGKKLKLTNPYRLREEVATWRKAYEVHDWFVQKYQSQFESGYVADINHDTEMEFDAEDLMELLDVVNKVLVSPDKAAVLLPYRKGLAAVHKDAQELLLWQLGDTKAQLEKILAEHDDWPLEAWYVYQYSD